MSKIIRPQTGRWVFGVFKGLESAGIGTASGWRIFFIIACCFSFGIPAILYFACAIIFPYEKSNKNKPKN